MDEYKKVDGNGPSKLWKIDGRRFWDQIFTHFRRIVGDKVASTKGFNPRRLREPSCVFDSLATGLSDRKTMTFTSLAVR